ncbi:ylbC [Symbiodinium sp. CCMP2456]|nr:ylbC [Symbiodinium sp. CCMP2456]
MGGSSSKASTCRVRNRLGCSVRLLTPQPPGNGMQQVEIAHGAEHLIEGAGEDGHVIAVRFQFQGQEYDKAFKVPSDAVLLLRAFEKGEIAFRVQTAAGSSPAEEAAVDPVQLWQAVVSNEDGATASPPPATGEVVEVIPGSLSVAEVSEDPLCYATGSGTWVDADPQCCDREEELDTLFEEEPAKRGIVSDSEGPQEEDSEACVEADPTWTLEQRDLYAELLDLQFSTVRARKALDAGCADLEDAVEWLEKHQHDDDIDISPAMLKAREDEEVALAVLRVLTIPALHRLSCLQALHRILRNILADPESRRVRQIRIQNPRFKERIGRFAQAVSLLRKIGFQQGDFWTSAFDREPCLEWRLPVGSANPMSQRMERAFSLIDEVLRAPDSWIPSVCAAMPEVKSSFGEAVDAPTSPMSSEIASTARDLLAEVHARRARDPRGFQEAMRAAGRQPNPSVYSLQSRATDANWRPLSERFPGKREFNLQDLENMRVEEAIGNMPLYAKEYEASLGQASSYGQLVSRSYDPNYLSRRALDETNIFRGSERMPPLKWCQGIADIAAEHARQMARGEMPFSHDGFSDRVSRYPIPHLSAAENLAYNSGVADTAGVAVQGWIKSPGHRKNLLGAFDLCGIGSWAMCCAVLLWTVLLHAAVCPKRRRGALLMAEISGGVALVVTICTKHFENQVLQYMQKEGRLILEDDTPFDNKGWTQCKVYTLRKPPAAQLNQKGCAMEATSTGSGYVRENRQWEMALRRSDIAGLFRTSCELLQCFALAYQHCTEFRESLKPEWP